MKSTEQPSENKSQIMPDIFKIITWLVLALLIMEAIHEKYSMKQLEKEMANQMRKQRNMLEAKIRKLSKINSKPIILKWPDYEIQNKIRKRRKAPQNQQKYFQVLTTIFESWLQRKNNHPLQCSNSTIICGPGPKGKRGRRGKSGPIGRKGAKGDTGRDGQQGESGPPGKEGRRGSKGDKGDDGAKGDKGEQGPPGRSAEIPKIITKLPNLTMPVSSEVSLFCEATGYPKPTLKWEFPLRKTDKRYIYPIEGGLNIKNITKKDSGEIRCVAESILGKDTVKYFLDVQFKPVIHIPTDKVINVDGRKIEVVCSATGNPKPTITWKKAHGDFHGSQTLLDEGKMSKLELAEPPRVKDSGYYVCTAENKLGSTSKSILIQISLGPKQDCAHWRRYGHVKNGVYRIKPDESASFDVFCDMTTDKKGWTVVQRRVNGSQDFSLSWNEYKRGFGNLEREFWLGNDKIHRLTKASKVIRFDLENTKGIKRYAEYDSFSIANEANKYRLHLGQYSGTAGDSFVWHSHQRFFTKDQDLRQYRLRCPSVANGGWWYEDWLDCNISNLNGKYLDGSDKTKRKGLDWLPWTHFKHSITKTEMKIRPKT